jgi:polyisoprenoid-binding protein YceI
MARALLVLALVMLGVACGGGAPPRGVSSKPACRPPAAGTRLFLVRPGDATAQYTARETITLPAIKALLKIVGDDNTAIGKTQQLTGEIDLSKGLDRADVDITADLRTLDSGVGLRDQRIRGQFLESDRYPWAIFRATGLAIPPSADGTAVTFDAPGTMTVRQITKPFAFHVTAQVSGSAVTGTATGSLKMNDFGFDPPLIEGAIAVKEGLDLRVEFNAMESECRPASLLTRTLLAG